MISGLLAFDRDLTCHHLVNLICIYLTQEIPLKFYPLGMKRSLGHSGYIRPLCLSSLPSFSLSTSAPISTFPAHVPFSSVCFLCSYPSAPSTVPGLLHSVCILSTIFFPCHVLPYLAPVPHYSPFSIQIMELPLSLPLCLGNHRGSIRNT